MVDYFTAKRLVFASVTLENTLYVDDLTIDLFGTAWRVELACASATLDACAILEKGMKLEVPVRKISRGCIYYAAFACNRQPLSVTDRCA